jgi:hypothetical protein
LVFAKHFYRGQANNNEEPVVTPSAAEVAAAETLTTKLLASWPSRVKSWGGESGRQVWVSSNAQRVTLQMAVRLHGDSFVVWQRQARKVFEEKQRIANRGEYEKQHSQEYLAFLKSELQRLKTENGESVCSWCIHCGPPSSNRVVRTLVLAQER